MKHTLAIILLSCTCWPAHSQPANPPLAFDVASVKPGALPPPLALSDGRRIMRTGFCMGGPGSSDPGRFTCQGIPLSSLISTAYDLQPYQKHFPGWMDGALFDITAAVPAGTTPEQLRAMQRTLLAERFKLAVHFEKQEMQVLELTAGKNGPKLTAASPAPDTPSAAGNTKLEFDKSGFPVIPRGMSATIINNGRARMAAFNQTMEQFASRLSNLLSKPVFDATGIKGKFDIELSHAPDNNSATPDTAAEPAPTLPEALQLQLGLKLEQRKGTVDMLMVDHVERTPAEN